jgi:hypothetical protein
MPPPDACLVPEIHPQISDRWIRELLCTRHQRPRQRAAKSRDEVTPPHQSCLRAAVRSRPAAAWAAWERAEIEDCRDRGGVICSNGRKTGQRADMRNPTLMSSGPEDFHLRALPEPYVNLSIHTAPVVRPLP